MSLRTGRSNALLPCEISPRAGDGSECNAEEDAFRRREAAHARHQIMSNGAAQALCALASSFRQHRCYRALSTPCSRRFPSSTPPVLPTAADATPAKALTTSCSHVSSSPLRCSLFFHISAARCRACSPSVRRPPHTTPHAAYAPNCIPHARSRCESRTHHASIHAHRRHVTPARADVASCSCGASFAETRHQNVTVTRFHSEKER